ncbi:cytochrome P450, family 71, subfamily A, polypeptide 26 [Hibiscus trionum]|uniref:Cytochrome P450, family 71, subfamily A, polypeptide 26 n=1 Tax=Hibiscus trionum TaxID=183268 RepID=A0A9W7JIK7_HIBTR|nr:cytochrome P450, family 71, subfamily A, polypeptide 26 [Hibiscus trionum]
MEFVNGVKLYGNPLFPCMFLFISFVIIFYLQLAKTKKKLNLPPSPPWLPIIGNFHQLGKLPHRSLRNLASKHGPLLLLQLGHNPTLVVSTAEMAEKVIKSHDVAFSSRPKTTAANTLLYGCTDVGFAPYGEYWRQVRKLSVVELFSHKRVESFQFVRDEEVELLVNKIRKASINGQTVNLTKMVFSVSNNIVSRCAIGRKIEEEHEDGGKFSELARRVMALLASFSIGDAFPYLWWMDYLTGFIPKLKATSAELDELLDQIIEERKDSDEVNPKKDFLSIMLELQKDGEIEMELTQDNIKAILMDMFIGGTDTTSTTTEWLMAELLKHPNIMKKVQEEVRMVVGNKPKIEADDINKMHYLKCVIKETLRLHPAVALLVPRQTSTTVKLFDYDIPSGITVFINAWAIQRDPRWWDKPEEFIPERFENNGVDFKGHDFQFIPFGCGRRRCPGLPFGVASVEYLSANLLYWFDWELCGGGSAENLDMDEVYGLTVNKKIPLHLLPVSHLSV